MNVTVKLHEDCCEEKWFEATIQEYEGQPSGFIDWAEGITQCKYKIYLPDDTRTHAKLFMDHQKRFDDFEFTRYLINRYNEIYDI